MAKFKCIHTGNVFEFIHEYDVKVMRTHPEYTEVIEKPQEEKKPSKKVKTEDQ